MLVAVRTFQNTFKTSRFMKAFLLIALSILTFAGCNRQNNSTVQPDRARRMAGTYQVNLWTVQIDTDPVISVPFPLPYNGQPAAAMSITITRKSENVVDQTVAVTFNKAAFPVGIDLSLLKDESYNVENLEIRDNGSGYDLFINGEKTARFDDNIYTFNRTVADPKSGRTIKLGMRATK